MRGTVLHEQRKLDLAVADYSRVLELEPGDAFAWTNRGLARNDLGDFDGAVTDCTQALELDPTRPAPWRIRGRARQQRNDFAGAAADYAQSLELDPAQPQVAAELAAARRDGGLFCAACQGKSHADGVGSITSLNGLGKTLYGEADPCASCGSVVRTLWMICFHLPIVPLGSYRVLQREFSRDAVGTRQGFSGRRIPMAWGQVAGTWLAGLFAIAAFAAVIVALVSSATSSKH